MRWPHRRQRRPDRRSVGDDHVQKPDGAPVDSREPDDPSPSSRIDEPIGPVRRPLPRTDWARLEPMVPVDNERSTLTFDGAAFGRSVAGAASIRSEPLHRRTARAASDAPAGVLLDAATLHTVLTPSFGHADDPPAHPVSPVHSDVVHRRPPTVIAADDDEPAVDGWSTSTPLTRSDVNIAFDEVRPVREPDVDIPTSISWTADDGFSIGDPRPVDSDEDAPETRMRLVGQHGSFTDAIRVDTPPKLQPDGIDDADADADAVATPTDPTVRYLPSERPRLVVETPAPDLVAIVADATGVDVGDARINRIEDGEADAVRAVAFTRDGEVHFPASRGSLDSSTNRPIVAHELTHVAQQRIRTDTPDERSAEGRQLEAHAQRVEAAVGGPVAPIFLPTRPSSPVSTGGVQRRTDEWIDVDDHAVDTIDEHDDRRYDWQQRPQPPVHAPDDPHADGDTHEELDDTDEMDDEASGDSHAWARRFELHHGAELQHRRDQRFGELVEDLANRRSAEGDATGVTSTDAARARHRLDVEMPYEFGPGADIDLYPEVRLAPATDVRRTAPSIVPVAGRAPLDGTLRHRTAPPAESRNDTTDGAADGSSSPTTSPARSSNEDDPINADLQRQLDAARSADQPETRHGSAMSIDALNAFFAVRFDRERDLRIEILNAKLSEVDDLEVGEILSLTEDEVVQIRGIVDAELPLDVPYPQYLPLTGYGAIDREGRFGAVNYRAQQRRNRADRENAARTDAATTPSSPAQAPTDGAVETPEIEASSDEDVRSALVVDADGTEVDTSERAGIDDDQRSTLAGDTSSTSRGASTEPDDIDQQEEISEIIASMSDLDVEMLSRRMYGRIRRTLRRELLIDRERAGTLADAC